MADVSLQRKNMVESQVRPSDITDRRITAGMSDLARERFLPAGVDPSLAYMDGAIPLGAERALMAPRTLARLLQLAAITPTDDVLIAGAATGYSAALVARMARRVVALESDEQLLAIAKTAATASGAQNITFQHGAPAAGHAPAGPYDVILIEGSVEHIPDALVSQLAPGGRLVTILKDGALGRATVLTKSGTAVSARTAFEAGAALLPGFAQPRVFSL